MPRKFRDEARRAGTAGLNWTMCVVCLVTLAGYGLLFYREQRLEARIASLEAECLRVNELSPPLDVIVQRVKLELQEHLLQAQRFASADSTVFRPKRDASECMCPPGKCLSTLKIIWKRRFR